jgi:hypothetical protein
MRNGTAGGGAVTPNNCKAQGAKFRPILLISLLIALAAGAAIFYFFAKQYLTIFLIVSGMMIIILTLGVLAGKAGKGVRILLRTISVLLVLIALMAVGITLYAPSQMFYPNFDEKAYRQLEGEGDAIAVSIPTEQGTLTGWFLDNAEDPSPLILYFGGNGENSSTRMLRMCRSEETRAIFEGYDFVFIDYPKYGKSEGELSEEALFLYALDVYDYFSADAKVAGIVPMGYSLGTGLANYVASKRDVAGLILMAPYADFYDMYNNNVDIFYGPMRLLVTVRMESVRFAEDIRVRPIVFASEADTMIPFQSSERLVRAYPIAPEFITLKDAGHNDFWGREEILIGIEEYLKNLVTES